MVANATKCPTPIYAIRKNLRESRLGRRGLAGALPPAGLPPAAAAAASPPLPVAFRALLLLVLLVVVRWKEADSRGPLQEAKPGPAAAVATCVLCACDTHGMTVGETHRHMQLLFMLLVAGVAVLPFLKAHLSPPEHSHIQLCWPAGATQLLWESRHHPSRLLPVDLARPD